MSGIGVVERVVRMAVSGSILVFVVVVLLTVEC